VDGTQHGDLQLAQHRAAPAAHPAHASAAALEGSQRATGGPRPGPYGISCAPRPGHRLDGNQRPCTLLLIYCCVYFYLIYFIFFIVKERLQGKEKTGGEAAR